MWFVAVTLYASRPQQDLKHSRNGHTICHQAVSKPVHLAETCTADREKAREACEGTHQEAEEKAG